MNAFEQLSSTVPEIVAHLEARGIDRKHLSFGGVGKIPPRKPTVPTDARSEFLANRAMGDWAEERLRDALATSFPDMRVAQYGDTGRIAAGHPDFKASYLAGLEETRNFGKRPDLLLFFSSVEVSADLATRRLEETDAIARQAVAAIEVRSSKFDALTYMAVRQRERESGTKSGREAPSFTVKVEDLVIVYRWIERYRVPQSYAQVFFDSVFMINFLEIFRTIASGSGFSIETPAKSQEKATIMIPITRGVQIGSATESPTFSAEHRVTKLGRHDVFVVPRGGRFELDPGKTRSVLLPS